MLTEFTWQHAIIFVLGIALQYLAARLNAPAPQMPNGVPTLPASPPTTPANPNAPAPQLGDGHVLRDILAKLIEALQKSQPLQEVPKP